MPLSDLESAGAVDGMPPLWEVTGEAPKWVEAKLVGGCNAIPIDGPQYVCTRPPHEDGTHVAHDSGGRVSYEWVTYTTDQILQDLAEIRDNLEGK